MDPVFVSGTVGNTQSSILTFANPLLETVTVSLSLPAYGKDFYNPAFELVNTRKSRTSLSPGEKLDISFNYTPKSMIGGETKLTVDLGGQSKWVYPIKVCH
jgi:hypothetical protein